MNGIYASLWRWHFYAGVFILPFLLILALSGLVMAVSATLEPYRLADKLLVTPGAKQLSASEQLGTVVANYPNAQVSAYIPPSDANRSSEFVVLPVSHQADHSHGTNAAISVFVNPYSGELLGESNPGETLYALAKKIHGTLLIGQSGDYLIELVASLAVLSIISGYALWWSRSDPGTGYFRGRNKSGKGDDRERYRSLHGSIALWSGPLLLFFLLSGLAWTPVWGGKLTQAWAAFPAARMSAPVADITHEDLNHQGHQVAPWALEKTPVPMSAEVATPGHRVTLDEVVEIAVDRGFTGYRVLLPQSASGAWTISAITMSGDIKDPRQDRTLHLDQYTGETLVDIGYPDYSLMGKAMALSISLHQAEAGWINLGLNLLLCLAVIVIVCAALLMLWKRRPRPGFRLTPPPITNATQWTRVMLIMGAVTIFFPLAFFTLLALLLIDFVLISVSNILRH